MSPHPLDQLLAQLCAGDAAAAQRAFVTYEPYLRKVVRRLLPERMRSQFDSLDIIQSVWGDVLSGFRESGWSFATPAQLQSFLVTITRNRFIDRSRQYTAAVRREAAVESTTLARLKGSAPPDPGEAAQAAELWCKLLAECPPEYHELLRLKRLDFSNTEIGEQLGMHPGSVRRILRELRSRLLPTPTAAENLS